MTTRQSSQDIRERKSTFCIPMGWRSQPNHFVLGLGVTFGEDGAGAWNGGWPREALQASERRLSHCPAPRWGAYSLQDTLKTIFSCQHACQKSTSTTVSCVPRCSRPTLGTLMLKRKNKKGKKRIFLCWKEVHSKAPTVSHLPGLRGCGWAPGRQLGRCGLGAGAEWSPCSLGLSLPRPLSPWGLNQGGRVEALAKV